jgi:CHASE2 domain-containing sensor protein
MITGPKTDHLVTGRESDHWLVMTVGALIAVIGLVLLVGGWRRRIGIEVVLLAIASAAGLAAIDVIYVARQVLSPIYLADATAELVIVALWALLIRRTGDHQAFGDRT